MPLTSPDMSDDVLSVIPTDPMWQPDPGAGERALALFRVIVPGGEETEATWHDLIEPIEAGGNLTRITCNRCRQDIDVEDYRDLVDEMIGDDDGLAFLGIVAPCCGTPTSLNDLEYDWASGFARFELAAWNPDRGLLTASEMAALADALGHPVRQVMARI